MIEDKLNKYGDQVSYDNCGVAFKYTDRCAVLVVPHTDDEHFLTASFLFNYKKTIYLFVTHSNDTINKETWLRQSEMFKQSIEIVNNYRIKNNYEGLVIPILFNCADFNGMYSYARKFVHGKIEELLDRVDKIDYYVTTIKSTHQSHTECNDIALSMMRSPYIEKCKTILLGTYPQSIYGLAYSDEYDSLNTYVPMTKEQVDITCDIIGNVYGEKNYPNSILGSEHFKEMLKFYGNCISTEYAQPYKNIRHKITLD